MWGRTCGNKPRWPPGRERRGWGASPGGRGGERRKVEVPRQSGGVCRGDVREREGRGERREGKEGKNTYKNAEAARLPSARWYRHEGEKEEREEKEKETVDVRGVRAANGTKKEDELISL